MRLNIKFDAQHITSRQSLKDILEELNEYNQISLHNSSVLNDPPRVLLNSDMINNLSSINY